MLIFVGAASASENIHEIGKIVFSKRDQTYYFVYLSDNHQVRANPLKLSNKHQLETIKKLVNKSVRLEGTIDWKRGSNESFSIKEELTILQMELFELNVLAFDSREIIKQDSLVSHYRESHFQQSSSGITVSDSVANSFISSGAVAIGVAAGPISLIPAALFGIYQMFL